MPGASIKRINAVHSPLGSVPLYSFFLPSFPWTTMQLGTGNLQHRDLVDPFWTSGYMSEPYQFGLSYKCVNRWKNFQWIRIVLSVNCSQSISFFVGQHSAAYLRILGTRLLKRWPLRFKDSALDVSRGISSRNLSQAEFIPNSFKI